MSTSGIHQNVLHCFFLCCVATAAHAGELRVMAIPSDSVPMPRPKYISELRPQGSATTTSPTTAAADPVVVASLPPSNKLRIFVSQKTITFVVWDYSTGAIIPNADATITQPKPVPNSGGHDHDDAGRPVGSFSILSGNTGATGFEFQSTYTAPEVSGIVDTFFNCTAPSGLTCFPNYRNPIGVWIPDLFELQPATQYDLIGANGTSLHSQNHFGTASFIAKLTALGTVYFMAYNTQGNNKLQFNDISLRQGGLFDIKNNWVPNHKEHRIGISGDLRLVPVQREQALFRFLKYVDITGRLLVNGPPAPHYHMREYGIDQ